MAFPELVLFCLLQVSSAFSMATRNPVSIDTLRRLDWSESEAMMEHGLTARTDFGCHFWSL
jgi:hypothetical protein